MTNRVIVGEPLCGLPKRAAAVGRPYQCWDDFHPP